MYFQRRPDDDDQIDSFLVRLEAVVVVFGEWFVEEGDVRPDDGLDVAFLTLIALLVPVGAAFPT